MQVQQVAPGAVSDYALNGTVLSVAGVDIDLATRQADTTVTVDLSVDANGVAAEGLTGGYVASVVIPPRRYQLVDSGELGMDDQPLLRREVVPLDSAVVTLFLWPVNK